MLPSLAKTSRTVPPRVATMSFCIFMASSTTTTSPRRTLSPGATLTLTTMPCMGAWIAPLPPAALAADGAATAARGAPAASPGTPSARIRTRYGSPSTSTVNSAPAGRGHRWITHFLANLDQLMHQPVIAIDGLALAEIANHDGQHRGRQLVLENVDVVAKGDRILELEILIVDLVEVPAGLADQCQIEAGVIRPVVQAGDHRLGGRLRRAPGER